MISQHPFKKQLKKFYIKKQKKLLNNIWGHYPKNRTLVVAGGVAANKQIRITLERLCKDENLKFIFLI